MKPIQFIFTEEQQETVAEYLGVDIDNLEDYEISELLDTLIDEHVSTRACVNNMHK